MTEQSAEYTFDEIMLGVKTKFTVQINESTINEFARIQEIIIHYIWMNNMRPKLSLAKECVMVCYWPLFFQD
ncbi:hypothetical protein EMGBD3_02580 [Nitrosarchaeum sp.]|nr:hypothetical protein EMGBD3_02580 [Nitrosarchaeum sp.]